MLEGAREKPIHPKTKEKTGGTMKYTAVIFDVSNTLVEYHPNWAKMYGDKIRSLGMEVTEKAAREMNKAVNWAIGEQTLKEQKGAPCLAPEETAMIKDRAALSCVDFPREMEADYLQRMARMPKVKQEMHVISGVFETLDVLKEKYRLAIVSNHHVWLADRLRELGLYEYFAPVVISEAVGVEKPDVRIMEIALKELELPPERCLYVGDHPLDVVCSKKAGMDCAWIAGDWGQVSEMGPYREDYRIQDVTELVGILC